MARLGELLVSRGACSARAVDEALQQQAASGARLGTHLIQRGAVREAQVADALARQHDVPSVSGDVPVDPDAVALVERRLAERYQVVPFLLSDRKLAVLARDPRDCGSLDELAFATDKVIHPFVVPEVRLWAMLKKVYGVEWRPGSRAIELDDPFTPVASIELTSAPEPSPAIGADLMGEQDFLAVYGR